MAVAILEHMTAPKPGGPWRRWRRAGQTAATQEARAALERLKKTPKAR